MKKKFLMVLCLALSVCLLSACSVLPASVLDAMFRDTSSGNTANTSSGSDTNVVSTSDDTVTISKELYERYQQFDDLLEIMDAVSAYYYEDADTEAMLQGAAAGLLDGVDDYYTFYYSPEEWEELWEDDEGVYAGIGIQITTNYSTGLCTVSRVFKGTPSETAGVQRGDILYKVGEDLYVTYETIDEAVSIMRGQPGTTVDVTFLRNGEEIPLTIERAQVTVNQIEYTMLTDDIGYIAFYQFAGECDKEFESALNDLMAQGSKGIIVDLRDNPGGWLEAAQNIADLFLDAGEVCHLVYKDGTKEVIRTKDGKTDVELVLLVNENSASSSEVLTGALKDRADATVVGVQTYGKGIVQSVLSIGSKGAGMQVTIAQYFTPNGNAVHKIGITPDVEITLPEDDNGSYDFADPAQDVQLAKAIEVMQKKLLGESITD